MAHFFFIHIMNAYERYQTIFHCSLPLHAFSYVRKWIFSFRIQSLCSGFFSLFLRENILLQAEARVSPVTRYWVLLMPFVRKMWGRREKKEEMERNVRMFFFCCAKVIHLFSFTLSKYNIRHPIRLFANDNNVSHFNNDAEHAFTRWLAKGLIYMKIDNFGDWKMENSSWNEYFRCIWGMMQF